jgi:hypothetical protein
MTAEQFLEVWMDQEAAKPGWDEGGPWYNAHLIAFAEAYAAHVAAGQQEGTKPPERTLQDYAIEHGGYLADTAQAYLDAKNSYDMAVAGYADGDEAPSADELSDYHKALRARIYEFRKRAKLAVAGVPASVPPQEKEK